MRFVPSRLVCLLLIGCCLHAGSARADGSAADASGGNGLPVDLGGFAIDAAERAMRAKIQDWNDDATAIRGRRALACGLAGAETALTLGTLASLALAIELPSLIGADGASGPSAALGDTLDQLAQQVQLTADEQQSLEQLRNRRTQDATDRTRLLIDTEAFLIRVTERLYQDQIDYHLGRTTGFLGFFRADVEYCAAYTLQAERDQQLAQAGAEILAFYGTLQQQLGN